MAFQQSVAVTGHRAMVFIPTSVGNTLAGQSRHLGRPVHPHACGEHPRRWGALACAYGSSPRLWGTLRISHRGTMGARFIPTPVGNTAGKGSLKQYMTVHPHACGEHGGKPCILRESGGSSPRLWGTRTAGQLRYP